MIISVICMEMWCNKTKIGYVYGIMPLDEITPANIYQHNLQQREAWITIFKFGYLGEVEDEFLSNEFWDLQVY